jgi:hypothetical protein
MLVFDIRAFSLVVALARLWQCVARVAPELMKAKAMTDLRLLEQEASER